jgi:hypothetical protein
VEASQKMEKSILEEREAKLQEGDSRSSINPHPSISIRILNLRTWKKVRKFLKEFGLTRAEQNEVVEKLGLKNKIL